MGGIHHVLKMAWTINSFSTWRVLRTKLWALYVPLCVTNRKLIKYRKKKWARSWQSYSFVKVLRKKISGLFFFFFKLKSRVLRGAGANHWSLHWKQWHPKEAEGGILYSLKHCIAYSPNLAVHVSRELCFTPKLKPHWWTDDLRMER